MDTPVMCETKRCGQRAAEVRFYGVQGAELRLCVWCALDARKVAQDRREEGGR